MWTDEQRFSPGPEVVSRIVDGEAVLLDLATASYFGLNEVGSRVWQHLTAGKTFAEIRDALIAEFDAPAEIVARDVSALLDELTAKGLVQRS